MINWINLAFNTLWIVALAMALAALSYASWRASDGANRTERKTRFRDELNQPGIQFFLNLAGFLFSSGLAFTSGRTFEKVIWFVLAALFLVQVLFAGAGKRKNSSHYPTSE
ncbi:MAG: hypothetical protein ACE5GO_06470 [Anaerolineales bacterium]